MNKDSLSKRQLEIIAETVLKEHQKLSKKEQAAEKDWRLRNTKLLLKHYQMLQKHCEEITEDLEDLGFYKNDAQIASSIEEKFWAKIPGIYIRIEEI